MTAPRAVGRFADSGVVVETGSTDEAWALATALAHAGVTPGGAGVEEVVVGFRSVTVILEPGAPDTVGVAALSDALASLAPAPRTDRERRTVQIPVAFDGPDLPEVAASAGLTPAAVVRLLEAASLEVAFVGFSPGFGYLVGLPPVLAAIPRRATPRAVVPAGSFALAGGFAGVYPAATPGGWHLVGRAGRRLFDPATAPFAVLQPGDRVRIVPVDAADVPAPDEPAGARPLLEIGNDPAHGARGVVVEEPGLFTLVEDAGRRGVASIGVPRAGAADPDALSLANALVGNEPGAAAFECTGRGPALRFTAPVHAALVGDAALALDGRRVPTHAVVPVAPGQTLVVGAVRDPLRAYLAVDGGVESPVVLASRSSDVLCGLGPGPLRRGDVLALGAPSRPRARLVPLPGRTAGTRVVHVVAGPDPWPEGMAALCGSDWVVGDATNRVGVRLRGPRPAGAPPAIASRGVVTGAVQVPPDGAPIVLGCDHATVGGYPVPATVVRADLAELGRCAPGERVVFEEVDLAGAAELYRTHRRRLEAAVTGWFPTRSA
ncbi:MAG TPA: carboxyltransferase domain-containing protein [Acidimicrobiales bacterium]|nr:carboxyltransferase domain-containing protein [Acidimicrobiales bacterium]